MSSESQKILSINSLEIGYFSKTREKILLSPLNASAERGELIAVIGRNGIGKSTLLRTLAGLQKSLRGGVYYRGRKTVEYSKLELAKIFGYISTEIIKVSNMSVFDLVALGRFPYTNWIGKIENSDNEKILEALGKTSMYSFRCKHISELSDGERQKAMIARIIAQDTQIMVMDEPTAFLDIASKYEILHLMHQLTGTSKKTIIFSTHDLQMAINQADKIWLLLNERLIEGSPEDLMLNGAFDHLFDSSSVSFNSEDGSFSFRNNTRGSIFLEGTGRIRHWTEKALNRAGFSVSAELTAFSIKIPSEKTKKWELSEKELKHDFSNLYELIAYLTRKTNALD